MNPLRPQHGEHVEHNGDFYRPLKVGEMRQAGDVYFWDGTMREEFFDETAQTSCDMGIEQSYRLIGPDIETSPTH